MVTITLNRRFHHNHVLTLSFPLLFAERSEGPGPRAPRDRLFIYTINKLYIYKLHIVCTLYHSGDDILEELTNQAGILLCCLFWRSEGKTNFPQVHNTNTTSTDVRLSQCLVQTHSTKQLKPSQTIRNVWIPIS